MDTCLIEHGAVIDPITETYIGFWDLLEKESILLTATASDDFQYILNSLFSVKVDQFVNFEAVIKLAESTSCATEIDY